MNTRIKITAFILLLAMIFGWGCSFTDDLSGKAPAGNVPATAVAGEAAQPSGPTGVDPSPETQPASDPAQAGNDAPEAVIVESNFQPIAVAPPTWGSVEFKADPAAAAEVDFPANGMPATLSLTDGAGITWTLSVPGIALNKPVKLKMTALTDIRSGAIAGALKAGILLEPDGLKFLYPATLTVSGGDLTSQIILFSGGQDGSKMDLVSSGEAENTWEILHFSSLVANDSGSLQGKPDLDGLKDQVSKADRETIDMVRKFLKDHKDDLEVPVPPSVPIECTDEASSNDNNQAVEKFIEDVHEPEGVLIRSLLKIKKSKALLGMEGADTFDLELRLMYRLEKKIDKLLAMYKGKEDKLIPVAQAALRVAKEIALLGGEYRQGLLDRVAGWCAQTVDQLVEDVANEHDYRKAPAVIKVARWAALLNNEYPSNELANILRKLEGAMRFKLSAEFKFTSLDSIFAIKTEIPMTLDIDPQSVGGGLATFWKGQGTGAFVYTPLKDNGITMTAEPFPINAFITKFDACTGEGQIDLDRFYADSEVMSAEDESRTVNFTFRFFDGAYKGFKGSSGILDVMSNGASNAAYNFPVKIRNKDVNAVEESPEGQTNCGGNCSVSMDIKLVHTPKLFK